MRFPTIRSRIILPLLLTLMLLLAACGGQTQSATPPAPTSTPTGALDAYGTPIAFPSTPPQRIISLI
jgi:ABC-type Fe3+-hydroxamate transport system substrate-binding protein